MQRLKLSAGAAVMATAALAAACTSSTPSGTPASWKLAELPTVQAAPTIQATIDAPPSNGHAKMVGLVDIGEVSLVLAVRGDFCEAYLVSDIPGKNLPTAPTSVGAKRPSPAESSDSHDAFPGSALSGRYTQGHILASPYFGYVDLGCSEEAIAVRVQGVPAQEAIRPVGATVQTRRIDGNLLISVGPSDLRQIPPASL